MTGEMLPTRATVKGVLRDLSDLSSQEYGLSLQALRADKDRNRSALRLERLTGILLKRHFARPRARRRNDPRSATGAKRMWLWDINKLKKGEPGAAAELLLLNKLRGPGPWNDPWSWAPKERNGSVITWDAFIRDVETERGLFKVVALYVNDVLTARERKTIAEYYSAKESKTFEAGLDLATVLADAALAPLYAAVGAPAVAVGLALFIADLSAKKLFAKDRHPDEQA